MLKLYKIIIVVISILFISSKTLSDVFETSDLIPIEYNKPLFMVGHGIFEDDIILLNINNAFEKLGKDRTLEVGYITSDEWTLGIEGKIKSHNLIKSSSKDKYKILSSKVSILTPPFLNILQSWQNKISFGISHIPDGKTYCYETTEFVVGGDENLCSKNGKKFYISEDKGNLTPALIFNSLALSSGLGLKKHDVFWNKKTSYELNIQNHYIENNINYGSGFSTINKNHLMNIPQKEPFFINKIKASFSNVQEVVNNWAFGYGITTYIITENNFKNSKFKDKVNFKLNTKLTKNFDSKYFISIGSIFSTNGLLDIENMLLYQSNEKLFNSPYGEINFKFGFFYDKKTPYSNYNDLVVLNNINKEIKKSVYEKNQLKVIKTDKIKKNKSKTLADYAIIFAKKNDKLININFN